MAIETMILDLLAQREPGKIICPSEFARARSDDWRRLMPDIRATATRMAAAGPDTQKTEMAKLAMTGAPDRPALVRTAMPAM